MTGPLPRAMISMNECLYSQVKVFALRPLKLFIEARVQSHVLLRVASASRRIDDYSEHFASSLVYGSCFGDRRLKVLIEVYQACAKKYRRLLQTTLNFGQHLNWSSREERPIQDISSAVNDVRLLRKPNPLRCRQTTWPHMQQAYQGLAHRS